MKMSHKNQPDQCLNMEDIRAEIDLIDREIVRLLGTRYPYVLAANV